MKQIIILRAASLIISDQQNGSFSISYFCFLLYIYPKSSALNNWL